MPWSGQLFRPGLQRILSWTDATIRAIPTLPQAGKRLRLHSLLLLPRTPYLPRMDDRGLSEAPDRNTPELWRKEGKKFYYHIYSRGWIPRSFLRIVFREVRWARRSPLLAQSRQKSAMKLLRPTRPVSSPSATHRSGLR